MEQKWYCELKRVNRPKRMTRNEKIGWFIVGTFAFIAWGVMGYQMALQLCK